MGDDPARASGETGRSLYLFLDGDSGKNPCGTEVSFNQHGQDARATFNQHGQDARATFSKHGQDARATFSKHGQDARATFDRHGFCKSLNGLCALVLSVAFSGCTLAPERAQTPRPGRDWTSPATGMEFVWIEALRMWVGKYEVTNGEYRRKEPAHDSKNFRGHSTNGDRQPVVYANFPRGKAYAEWLTEQDRDRLGVFRYRMPSVEEFQVYAQCGDGRVYPWGDAWPPVSGQAGNYLDQSAQRTLGFQGMEGYDDGFAVTAPVEESWVNPWGLYGVSGNVWEACAADSSGAEYGQWRGAAWVIVAKEHLRCDFGYSDAEYGKAGHKLNRKHGFRLVLAP
jgi:formylglycine-generating enzyme required for sulfatase activity